MRGLCSFHRCKPSRRNRRNGRTRLSAVRFPGSCRVPLPGCCRSDSLKHRKPNDTPDDLEPLQQAGKYLFDAGFTKASHVLRCYVLIGYPKDTPLKATKRLKETWNAGFMPMAMLYRDQERDQPKEWERFQREWANPVITASKVKEFDI